MPKDPKVTFEIDAELDKINKKLEELEKEFKESGKAGKEAGEKSEKAYTILGKKIQATATALAGLYAAYKATTKAVGTAAEFEKLETRLVSLYNSVERGSQAFEDAKKVAAGTPFRLQDIVAAQAQLKAFGAANEGTLKAVADLAAFMDTTATEAASAFGRAFAAGAGAADILRERGVLNLVKSFKGIDDITKISLPEFREAMLETFQDATTGVAGSTDRLSATFVGAVSNMQDALDSLAAAVGDKLLPALKKAIGRAEELTRAVTPIETEFEKVTKKSREQSREFETLSSALLRLRQQENLTAAELEYFKEVQEDIKKIAPELVKEIDLEKDSIKKLADAFDDVNRSMIDKMTIEIAKAEVKDFAEERFNLRREIRDLNKEYDVQQQKLRQYKDEENDFLQLQTRLLRDNKTTELEKLQAEEAFRLRGLHIRQKEEFLFKRLNTLRDKEFSLDEQITQALKDAGLSLDEIFGRVEDGADGAAKKADDLTKKTLELNKVLEDSLKIRSKLDKTSKNKNPFEKFIDSQFIDNAKQASSAVDDLRAKVAALNNQLKQAIKEDNAELIASLGEKLAETSRQLESLDSDLSFDNITSDIENASILMEQFAENIVSAGLAGEDMGETLLNYLKQILAKLTAASAVFGLLQLIPGGAAFAGPFSGFISQAFGFSGAGAATPSAAPQIQIQGALQGQKFYVKSINREKTIFDKRKY